MSIKNFKPGDKVIVKSDLVSGIEYDGCYCNGFMVRMAGQCLTIKSKIEREHRGVYRVKGSGWVFVDEMLEPFGLQLDIKICCSREASNFETEYKPTDIDSVISLYGGK